MKSKKVTAIYAVDLNNVLAVDGVLPWHIGSDLKHFREKTENNIVIMGYKTFLSRQKTPFKNRINIILADFNRFNNNDIDNINKYLLSEEIRLGTVIRLYDAKTFKDFIFDDIIKSTDKEIFVIGGAKTFSLLKNYINNVIETKAECVIKVNDNNDICYLPKDFLNGFSSHLSEFFVKSDKDDYSYRIIQYEKECDNKIKNVRKYFEYQYLCYCDDIMHGERINIGLLYFSKKDKFIKFKINKNINFLSKIYENINLDYINDKLKEIEKIYDRINICFNAGDEMMYDNVVSYAKEIYSETVSCLNWGYDYFGSTFDLNESFKNLFEEMTKFRNESNSIGDNVDSHKVKLFTKR